MTDKPDGLGAGRTFTLVCSQNLAEGERQGNTRNRDIALLGEFPRSCEVLVAPGLLEMGMCAVVTQPLRISHTMGGYVWDGQGWRWQTM